MEKENGSDKKRKQFQDSAMNHWKSFKEEKMFYRDPMLAYTKPIVKISLKIARVDPYKVKEQAIDWNTTAICMVLGANLPWLSFKALSKRIWGHLGIAQIVRMTMGLIMIKFNDEATRDQVLKAKGDPIRQETYRSGGNPFCLGDMADSNDCISQAHVEPLKSTSSTFTWTNNQDGVSRIYSKIAHAFVNEDWHDMFANSTAHFGKETTSDHCSCVFSTRAEVKIGIKLFRCYNFWVDHPDFKRLVLSSWEKPMTTPGLNGIYLKLMRLKHSLKKFNHETIGDVGKNYQQAKDRFLEARMKAQENPRDHLYQEQEKTKTSNFICHEKMYFNFLRQRSKINWLQKRDDNTKYFHAFIKKRKVESTIAIYTNEQGVVIDNFPQAANNSNYRFHLMCKSLRIVNLCFADDLTLVSKCTIQSISALKQVPYHKAVWSSLNLPKHHFVLWQVVNSQLLTRDNMARVVDLIFFWLGNRFWPLDFKDWISWLSSDLSS
uniref:Uncharacterized protein n=1 Tax=Cannabis sativa TaxID=3483 RepID=A0A803QI20_CANSA